MSMPKERYIWVASVALAALAVAAALYVDGRVTATALQQHRHYQLRALSRVSRGLRKELNDSVADLLHLSRLESFRRSRVSEARLDLEKLASVTRMRGLEGIELYDLEGKLLLQVPRQPGELLDSRRELGRADLRWASLPSNAGAVRLRVVPDGGFGPTLRVMTPVYERQETADRGGPVQAVGVVAGRVNLDTLAHRLLSDLAFTTSTQAFLVAGDHALAAFPDTLVSFDKPLPTEPRWREGAYAQEGFGWMDWVFANGVQRAAVAWLPLQVGEERWLLLAVTPGGELAGFEEHYFVLILAFGVVATVIGAGALLVRVQRSRQRLVSEVAREQQRVREAGERAWQNALLGQIVDDMRRFTDVVALLGRAARAAAEGLEASRSVIYLPDGHGLYRVEATHVRSGVSKPGPGADLLHALLGPGPLSSPLTANDLQGDSNPERREVARRLEVRSALLAPLPYGQESSGILALYECRRPRVWRDSEIRFAERLAAQVGTALEQAELYAELVRTAEVRSGLLKVAQALSVARRSLPVLELAVRVAAPLVRCRRCLILVDEESDGRWTVGAHHGLAEKGVAEAQRMRLDPSMHPYLEEVIRSRGTLSIPVVKADWRVPLDHSQGLNLECMLVLPMLYGADLMGIFIFERAGSDGAFGEAETEVAQVVSELTAGALRNAQLFEALRASEARYQDLYDKSPDMYQTVDRRGRILDCNETQSRQLGFGKKEIIGKSLDDFLAKESTRNWQKALRKVFGKGMVRDVSLKLRTSQGDAVDVLLNGSVIRDSSGEVVGARVVLRDVSQVKELEQQLQQSQKLEVIGSLAGGVAHDFNNVLGGILGYASLLRSQLRDQPLVAKYVKTIERSAVRGSELAGKLLAASRRTGLPIEPIDFNQIVEETLELLARTLHKSIRIEKSLDRRLGLLLGERSQMQQVVLNLCVNARDAMQSGGVLRLETEYLEQEGKLRFSVKDTGTGMTADTMKRIFEPFFTTRGPSGTGLGLSVVYGIVKSNDGDIRVQSSPGQGSRFDVFLPASWTEEEAYVFEPHDPVRGHGELILLVDDEEVLRDLGRDILESFGYRVETARSGEQGIDVFRRRRDEIALVLLDLVMPGLDGAETCRRLRSLAPDVPVLILSGLSQEGTVDQLLQEGAQGFVPKPYAIGDLTRAVSDALRGGEPPSVVH